MLVDNESTKRENAVNRVEEEQVLIVHDSLGLGWREGGGTGEGLWCIRREEVGGRANIGRRNEREGDRGFRLPSR